jgi:hypothetical protein
MGEALFDLVLAKLRDQGSEGPPHRVPDLFLGIGGRRVFHGPDCHPAFSISACQGLVPLRLRSALLDVLMQGISEFG